MTFTIVTDEPLEKWCRPVHEGQVVEVLVSSPLVHSPGQWTTPIKRRYVATTDARFGFDVGLVWIEMPNHPPRR